VPYTYQPAADGSTSKAISPVSLAPIELMFGSRIVERLSNLGWREEIPLHRQEYLRCITAVKGACVARTLSEKGTGAHSMEKCMRFENHSQRGAR